ncbi:hypothetical protein H6P81_008288 [Aristolochia fimbriata]|uniref:Steroid 5-alpha reductase C-terminal domain-containing protein n=1 Tax=Aristolochia fimbriata TaxID=158543 RepID=A0AAV7F3A7_ARIFI|nr:hypothetical protein H6P81_008288 [Aristolochia fimbriata]
MGNLLNMFIAFLVPLPSIVFYRTFLSTLQQSPDAPGSVFQWCSNHPLFLANILFFVNVNVIFWLIGLLQSSHWLIDLYWTVVPVMLVHYYASHPYAKSNFARSLAVILLTWVWSVRLTHNYFRREKWQWGSREDWRFSDMRRKYGKSWWWVSFFAVYLVQQVFLVGICLPMYAVYSNDQPWNVWDTLATVVCISGIIIAYFADTQLFNYVERNRKLKELGEPPVANLDEGLWRYSRHPNYFGEQLWWWGLVIYGWNLGHGWTFIGSLVNSLCLAYVTGLVERRMLKREDRAEAYRLYQKTTSVWIPWFRSNPEGAKDKKL